jgi:nucleotide-binding universal stress UspA family protein
MFSTIAVGTDGSATASEAVKAAIGMAKQFGSELVLVSAISGPGKTEEGAEEELQWASNPESRTRAILERTEAEVKAEGIECRTAVDEGEPADVLVRLAGECGADLLVIGNKGMKRRVLGSVPNSVTHQAACSVFVVKTT